MQSLKHWNKCLLLIGWLVVLVVLYWNRDVTSCLVKWHKVWPFYGAQGRRNICSVSWHCLLWHWTCILRSWRKEEEKRLLLISSVWRRNPKFNPGLPSNEVTTIAISPPRLVWEMTAITIRLPRLHVVWEVTTITIRLPRLVWEVTTIAIRLPRLVSENWGNHRISETDVFNLDIDK